MKAIKNSILLYIAYVWNFIGGFVQLKLLTLDLTKDLLGKFFFAGTIGIFVGSIAQVGFPYVFQRFIPRYDHENRHNDKLILVWFSLIFHIAMMFTSIPLIVILFKGNLSYLLIYIGFYLTSHIDLFFNIYISQRKAYPVTLLRGIYYLILILMLITIRPLTVLKTSYALLISSLFILSLTYIHLPFPQHLSLLEIKRIFLEIKKYFLYSVYTHFLGPLFMYIDRIMIPPTIGYGALSMFQIARKIEQGARGFLFVPMSAFAPELAKLYEEGKHKSSFSILKKLTFAYTITGAFITILFIIFGKQLIILVSNQQYLSAYPQLVILMIAFFISLIYAPYTTYRRARGGMDFFFKVNAIWLISFLLFTLLTIQRLKLFSFSFGMLFATSVVLVYSLFDLQKFLLKEKNNQ